VEEAGTFRWAGFRKVAARDVQRLCQQLNQDRPVVLSVKTYSSWDYPSVQDTGEIPMPLPGNQPDGAHAICLVGYELRDEVPGGGAFIFRNSWGRAWARRKGRFGEGYGTLFFDYVKKYALEGFA
jgi:C1A family cysteine protease